MEIIGKPTINPILFYSGKISGYVTWLLFVGSMFGEYIIPSSHNQILRIIAYVLYGSGLILFILSSIGLGKSIRLGIPRVKTTLKTYGIYKISRNPMYLGFDILTLASIIGTQNILFFILGMYSIVIYHLLILGEERYLKSQYGEEYKKYIEKVRRYL